IILLGNHELPHIYDFPLAKPGITFTTSFERKIKGERAKYIEFFKRFSMAVRTKGGVLINHSGADSLTKSLDDLRQIDHDGILAENRVRFEKFSPEMKEAFKGRIESTHGDLYEHLLVGYLAIDPDVDKERYDALMEGMCFKDMNPKGEWFWDMLMNKNESTYGSLYEKLLERYLTLMSEDGWPIKVVVTGHIDVSQGYEVLYDKQLRIGSSKGVEQDAKKRYLSFDVSVEYESATQLSQHLRYLYPELQKEEHEEEEKRVSYWQRLLSKIRGGL
ncbi:MAG: hypothetical protein HY731_08920, partial [Candidatus Tectomicrobia bacterium]|nr:hypothetical protein [Candidatus Tectomicrobia bacterium]